MAAGKLEVEIIARLDKLEKGLQSAEQRVKKTGKTMDDALATPTGKMAVNMGKVFAVMGVAEGAVKGIGGAAHAVAGVFKGLTGDTEGMRDSLAASSELIKTLPFGIGALVAGFEQVAKSLMGIAEREERLLQLQNQLVASRRATQREKQIVQETKLLEMQYELMIEGDEEHSMHLAHQLELEQNAARMNQKMASLREAAQAALAEGDEQTALNLRHAANALKDQMIVQEMIINAKKKENEAELMRKRQAEEQAKLDQERVERERKIADEKRKAAQEEKRALEEQVALEEQRMGAISSRLGMVSKEAQTKSGFTNQGQTAFGTFTFGEQNVDEKIRSLQEEANNTQKSIDKKTTAIEQILQTLTQKIGFA